MSCFDLKKQIYNYLGYRRISPQADIDCLIDECVGELDKQNEFRAIHKIYGDFPEFLNAPPYASFLDGCNGAVLCVTTLGHSVDSRIKTLSRTDMLKSVVYDCCASAYLEERSNAYEAEIASERTYRFCPGYGGSSIKDLKIIFDLLRPEKIGVTLNKSYYMLPSKSMAGVIGLGKSARKNCGDCAHKGDCEYLKEGVTCYN